MTADLPKKSTQHLLDRNRQNGKEIPSGPDTMKKLAAFAQDESQLLYNSGLRLEFGHIPSGQSVGFKAFLTNFAEQYNSQWNAESALGRMDPIHTFRNTSRTITLGWNLVSNSVMEAAENQRNLTRLIQMLYPSYSQTDGEVRVMATPPLMKLKFANLIQDVGVHSCEQHTKPTAATNAGGGTAFDLGVMESGLVGRIDGLSIVPDSDAGYVVIPGDDGPLIYPKTIGLNCTFYVIHTHLLGWDQKQKRISNPMHPYGMDSQWAMTSDEHNAALNESKQLLAETGTDGIMKGKDPTGASGPSDTEGAGLTTSVTTAQNTDGAGNPSSPSPGFLQAIENLSPEEQDQALAMLEENTGGTKGCQ